MLGVDERHDAAAAATSRVATGTMKKEFYKLMMGEIEV